MILRTLGIILLNIIVLYGNSGGWKELPPLIEQSPKAFHLPKDILALEIRTYSSYENGEGNELTVLRIYPTPRHKIKTKMLQQFERAKPNFTRKSDILQPSFGLKTTSRAFALYKNGKITRMNEISDIIHLLGKIDTPVKAHFVLWLHSKYSGHDSTKAWSFVYFPTNIKTKYKKIKDHYRIMQTYTLKGEIDKNKNEFYIMSQTFTDLAEIDQMGKVKKFKQISQSKVAKKFIADEEPDCQLPLPEKDML